MADGLELPVRLYGTPIGQLVRTERGALLQWADGLPWPLLSPVLSAHLRVGVATVEQTESFFGGLLPEGTHLGDLARRLQVAREDVVGLLAEVGADLAGALTVGQPPEKRDPEVLTAEQVAALTAQARGFLVGGGGSALPGFQRKLTLTRQDGRWVRGNGTLPSTHILKPVPIEDRSAAEAERYVLEIARDLGLLRYEVWTEDVGSLVALVVERYDRRRSESGSIERLHQEDAGQALGLPWGGAEKFEVNDERASLKAIAGLLDPARTIFNPARPDAEALLRYTTLNVAAGNTDAHAKNFSLIHDEHGGIRLAPFYDSAPLALGFEARTDLAMRIGGVRNLPDVTVDALVDEAASWDLAASGARSIIEQTLDGIIEATRRLPAHPSIEALVPGYIRGQAENLARGRPARIESPIPLALRPRLGTPQDRGATSR